MADGLMNRGRADAEDDLRAIGHGWEHVRCSKYLQLSYKTQGDNLKRNGILFVCLVEY